MADRIVDEIGSSVPEINHTLAKVLQYVALDAKETMIAEKSLVPFTAVVVKENMFLEEMSSTETDHVYAEAQHTVQNVKGAEAYALCYDGYVETDAGKHDAIIAEGGVPGEETGYAVALVYELNDGEYSFMNQVSYIGKAPNFMSHLNPDDKFVPADDGLELIGGETTAEQAADPQADGKEAEGQKAE